MMQKCGRTSQTERAEVRLFSGQSGGSAEDEVENWQRFCATRALGIDQSLMFRDSQMALARLNEAFRANLAPVVHAGSLLVLCS